MQHQHHHLHTRKREAKDVHPYPSKIFRIAIVDTLVYTVSILSPILTIPQVLDIYVGHNAAGVSSLSWGAYTLFSIPWLAYGILHKEKVLIVNNSLWIFLNAAIFIGSLIY